MSRKASDEQLTRDRSRSISTNEGVLARRGARPAFMSVCKLLRCGVGWIAAFLLARRL